MVIYWKRDDASLPTSVTRHMWMSVDTICRHCVVIHRHFGYTRYTVQSTDTDIRNTQRGDAMVEQLQITTLSAIRAAHHPEALPQYDRVVFEFSGPPPLLR